MLMNFVFFMKMFQEKKQDQLNLGVFKRMQFLIVKLLICLRDDENKLIGAGYFSYTLDQGVYAIAASDRSYFKNH